MFWDYFVLYIIPPRLTFTRGANRAVPARENEVWPSTSPGHCTTGSRAVPVGLFMGLSFAIFFVFFFFYFAIGSLFGAPMTMLGPVLQFCHRQRRRRKKGGLPLLDNVREEAHHCCNRSDRGFVVAKLRKHIGEGCWFS